MVYKNYIFACLDAITKYEKIYSNGIDLNEIIASSSELEVADLSRFRVFLDTCMLTLNKEKMDEDFENKCDFESFLRHINVDETSYRSIYPVILRDRAHYFFEDELVKRTIIIPDNKEIAFYYSSGSASITAKKQIEIVRKAFAHSQYSDFSQDENTGYLLGYSVDNAKDDNINRVETGKVISDVIHTLVLTFYSDYPSIGIPYQISYILPHSIKNEIDLTYNNLILIKPSKTSRYVYDGFSDEHPMIKIPLLFNANDLKAFYKYIAENKTELEITEIPLDSIFNHEQFTAISSRYNLNVNDTRIENILYFDTTRIVSDPETMISNALTSVAYLNDMLIYYLCGWIDRNNLLAAIKEIHDEDAMSVVSNRIGFVLMKSWLVAYMWEYEKKYQTARDKTIKYYSKSGRELDKLFDCSLIDISLFDYNQNQLNNYVRSNSHNSHAAEEFVMKRFRDALMHGHLKVETNNNNQLVVAFYDINKDTQITKIVKIAIEDLEDFLEKIISYVEKTVNPTTQQLRFNP